MSVPPEPAGWRAIEALLWSILAVERGPTRFLATVDDEGSEVWLTPSQLARVLADHATGDLAAWLDEQIAEADDTLRRFVGRNTNAHARTRALREVRDRLGATTDTTEQGEATR